MKESSRAGEAARSERLRYLESELNKLEVFALERLQRHRPGRPSRAPAELQPTPMRQPSELPPVLAWALGNAEEFVSVLPGESRVSPVPRAEAEAGPESPKAVEAGGAEEAKVAPPLSIVPPLPDVFPDMEELAQGTVVVGNEPQSPSAELDQKPLELGAIAAPALVLRRSRIPAVMDGFDVPLELHEDVKLPKVIVPRFPELEVRPEKDEDR